MQAHYITWYNVENLFDSVRSELRPEWLQRRLRSELKGWTKDVVTRKIKNLTSVIAQINDGQGPDILGVAEVENENVVQLFAAGMSQATGRNYGTVHQDTKDQRGVDIAFIYDKDRYSVNPDLIFSLEIMKRAATRDMLQTTFTTGEGNELILIGNHWPARLGGKYESEPYRCMVGETLSYWLDRIQEIKGMDTPVLVMGDFNDEPYSRALTDYALSVVDRDKVVYGRNPYLYNLMWPILGQRRASFVYGGRPQMIDQFLVTRGIVKSNNTFSADPKEVRIEVFEGMVKGRYDVPVRFGRPSSSGHNPDGFSDHLPISCILKEN